MWNSICKSYRFLVRFRSLLCLGHSLLRFKPFHCISGCRFRVVLLEGELHLSLKSSAASYMFLPCLTCVYRHISSHHLYMAFLSPVLRLICPEHHLPYVCCVPLFSQPVTLGGCPCLGRSSVGPSSPLSWHYMYNYDENRPWVYHVWTVGDNRRDLLVLCEIPINLTH